MNRKRMAETLAEFVGGSVDQREQELRDLIWLASIDEDFKRAVERAMKQAAREYRDEMKEDR